MDLFWFNKDYFWVNDDKAFWKGVGLVGFYGVIV